MEVEINDKRRKLIEEARTWLGTPFKHQGRVKGKACDCIGLIVKTTQVVLNHPYHKHEVVYKKIPIVSELLKGCYKWMEPINLDEALPGDVVLLKYENEPTHFGFITDKGIIHSEAKSFRKVVEHGLDKIWKDRIVKVFRIPGVD